MSKAMTTAPTAASVTGMAAGKKKTTKTKIPKSLPKPPKFSYSDSLTGCARDYGALLADPFVKEHHACVPSLPAFESQKITVWNEGTFVIGTAGTGVVAMNPFAGPLNTASVMGIATTSAYAASVIPAAGTAGVNSLTSNSPYSAGGPGFTFRVVAAGVRCWYSGPINVMGGDIVALQDPNHNNLTNSSFTQLLGSSQSRRSCPAMGVRYGCVYTPISATELDYELVVPMAAPLPFMAIMVQGAAGLQFSYEMFAHYEFQGPLVRGKTPVHVDSVGVSSVLAISENPSASTAFSSKSVKDDVKRVNAMWDNMGHYALKGVSGVGHLVSQLGLPGVSTAGAVLAFGAERADDFLYDGSVSSSWM
jgi:hypothetical protein